MDPGRDPRHVRMEGGQVVAVEVVEVVAAVVQADLLVASSNETLSTCKLP